MLNLTVLLTKLCNMSQIIKISFKGKYKTVFIDS